MEYLIPIAGCLGSLVSILVASKYNNFTFRRFLMHIGRLVAGSVTGFYLTPLALLYTHLDSTLQQSISFVIGVTVTQIITAIHRNVHKELDSKDVIDIIKSKTIITNSSRTIEGLVPFE